MTLSVSLVLLLAAVVIYTVRKASHRLWHAAAAALLGFYLARTAAAPTISNAVTAVVNAFSHIHL